MRSNGYSAIKDQIIKLELRPGQKITENELAERFQVSRTPIREAISRLSQEGLIDVYPQRGTFVSLIDEEHVEEGRFMREHMEIAVVKLACKKLSATELQDLSENLLLQEMSVKEKNYQRIFQLDEDFHRIIFAGCKKQRTWQSVQSMMVNLNRTRMLSLASEYNWEMILDQHKKIYEAIKQWQPEKAEYIMQEHLSLVNIDLAELKERYAGYFQKQSINK
ncbi:GntR family transcriptional regulator [Salibacterium aidingense]|uniref:GntR family transcriptional regulator n=1 Tax=Salibacterium aidingense TaxID=384933 RepID=UPI0004212635|nr:GntR family transcriptional regulator [Salibacterium aidingense]